MRGELWLLRRMWSGFSSEIETPLAIIYAYAPVVVACGAASHLRLKPPLTPLIIQSFHCVACGAASHLRLKLLSRLRLLQMSHGRMWSGFSSEIETLYTHFDRNKCCNVACGAASHLRLKQFLMITMKM